jgi:hypothetical protein
MDWSKLADDKAVEKTIANLNKRGFEATVVDNAGDAKKAVIELIPKKSHVLEVSSTTMNQIGVTKAIDDGDYGSVNKKIREINDPNERNELRKRSMNAEYVLGSVHAVTEDGQILTASASGSQIPPYSYTADKVILVAGTQKIVKSLDDGIKRIYEHSLPLESERMMKAYGTPSSVNKILIYEKERPGRIKIILVKEKLGF